MAATPQNALASADAVNVSRRRMRARQREWLWFYLIISPWLVGLIVLLAGPMVYSIYLSFTDWNLFQPPKWIGLDNYVRLLTRDRTFGNALSNTFIYTMLYVPLNLALSLGIAYLLNKRLPGMRFFRTVIYLPYVVPVVATTMVFRWVFAPENGLLNSFLRVVGIDGPAWLLDDRADHHVVVGRG
jgi:multiple sugar transport system permease protein